MRQPQILLTALVVTLAVVGTVFAEPVLPARRIALSFDDVPRGDGPFFSGAERTDALIAALKAVSVDGAMFFVTTKNLDAAGADGEARLRQYTRAGHVLGNHSHSHSWLSRTPTAAYVEDIDKATARLAEFDGLTPYFRFPFLDEGREVGKRDAVRRALRERKLQNGYVTVDNYDWYMVMLAAEALAADHPLDLDTLRDTYVELLVDAVEFYDAMAQDAIGRSPQHVLLLHENDLAAMFVDDLVTGLRAAGWRIIPALDAFTDPIANEEPDTLSLGQGRIAAIAHTTGRPPDRLVHVTESEPALRAEFVRRGLLPADGSAPVE